MGTTDDVLAASLQPGTIIVHHTGGTYRVIAISRQVVGEGNQEHVGAVMVTYRALYTSANFGPAAVWTRPIRNMFHLVNVEPHPVPRFKIVRQPGFFYRLAARWFQRLF